MKVAVVGGGIVGCTVAMRLAQRGVACTVIERSIPGAEASSAAAGILAAQAEADGPGPFLELCLRSRALYPSFVEELEALSGVRVNYRTSGALHAAFTAEGVTRLQRAVAWQRAADLRSEWLWASGARALEPALAQTVLGAAHFPDDHQVDNRLLMRALPIAASRAGVRFTTGTVRGLVVDGECARGVAVDGTRLEADAVVVAAGAWTALVPDTGLRPGAVRPVRGQMLMLQTRAPLLERVVFSDRGYLVPRADGRLVAGSTTERAGYDKRVTAAGLQSILALALELCPALGDATVLEHWAGFRPDTEDHLPLLGPAQIPGLFVASGHFRNGILLAPVTGELLTQSVLGEATSTDLSPFRPSRPILLQKTS